ncbi:hypothetical protein LJC41_00195 [Desulfosarcina sp. OttesenSCG-928-G17]|nr:hypothetical protein [Desulfosarcina sp. OttesenSCG-928-G17]
MKWHHYGTGLSGLPWMVLKNPQKYGENFLPEILPVFFTGRGINRYINEKALHAKMA